MADSTLNDINKMKVADLRKELKSRGLPYTGDKAVLVARLQGAISQEDHADINLDSDEIDSDGVLEDEDDKSQNDIILDDPAVDTINEELALAEHSPPKPAVDAKPQRTLKRKIVSESANGKSVEKKEEGSKKIVLNRSTSITTIKPTEEKGENAPEVNPITASTNKIKITCDMDAKTRLEMRAKRFGLPVKVSDDERKEARKQRFSQNSVSSVTAPTSAPVNNASLTENLDKLRKRAERFGQNVSSIMTVIENKEKLEKRKEKFNIVK